MKYLLLLLTLLPLSLSAQHNNGLQLAPPPLDTLHFPIWPGCYDPKLSEQQLYQCTRECMATLIYSSLQWPAERLLDSGYVKISVHINQHGKLDSLRLFRELNPLLDGKVLNVMNASIPNANWRPAYLNGHPKSAEFVA